MDDPLIFRSILSLAFLISCCLAVKREDFKTCEQSSFCRRNRALHPGDLVFSVVPDSVEIHKSLIIANVKNNQNDVLLLLNIDTLAKDTARVRLTEKNVLHQRYEVHDSLIKLQEQNFEKVRSDSMGFKIKYGQSVLEATFNPLRLDFFDLEGALVVSVNSKGLMNFEHYRNKDDSTDKKEEEPPQEDGTEKSEEEKEQIEINRRILEERQEQQKKQEEGMWEESFKGAEDTKPLGPSSISMDVSFIGFENVYGIPEHADSLSLKETKTTDPYRLFNLDVFEYELNNPMALYGSIPFMWAHSARKTVGLFWNNAAETWVDIKSSKSMLDSIISFFGKDNVPEMDTHWISESGVIDFFVMLGPKPLDVSKQYAALTGTTALPPLFSIAYHQCRWNYDDEKDVAEVAAKFDEHDIPFDVIWLDIEHTDDKKYYTWHPQKFPNSKAMIDNVASKGRKMVTIIDPHIKRVGGYHIHDEATSKGMYVKNKDGNDYEGWCWPGSSSWIDFTNPDARAWWASKYHLDQYQGSTLDLFTWNDMNEPSVFSGPEITMHKDAKHHLNWEHRDVHNIYGMYQQMSTYEGHLQRSGGKERPFILSRAFFAGTQRYGAIWTGDNFALWEHLQASVPMLLSINLAGLPFAGADVGGFFGNPSPELLVRWYQLGSFTPFFRAHAHIDTKRREPWLFGEENTKLIRAAIRRRYALLPMWYTMFYETHKEGTPIMRPMWMQYPEDKSTFAMDDQFLLGSNLLVKPVTESGKRDVIVYLPGDRKQIWYDFDTHKAFKGGQSVAVDTPMSKMPVFIRGGTILPMKNRVRRASSLMFNDPYTLIVALDSNGEAKGDLYIDDGHSLENRDGKYIHSKFTFGTTNFIKWDVHSNLKTSAWYERIAILGWKSKPTKVTYMGDNEMKSLEFVFDSVKQVLVVKKPSLDVTSAFSVLIS